MGDKYDCLKLKSQLCFPLYACSKEIIRKYKPFLDKFDLTYTQYITMMALWENESMNVRELGLVLFLDSGTLTPVLKKLESKGYLERKRSKEDERNLIVTVTEKGWKLLISNLRRRQNFTGFYTKCSVRRHAEAACGISVNNDEKE